MKSLYMIAIEPPHAVSDKIRQLQEEFAKNYGSAAALKPPVHVTFSAPVLLDEQQAVVYKDTLSDISKKFEPVELILKDFDFFIRAKVLFVRVIENRILNTMQGEFENLMGFRKERSYHPHITIGYRKILPHTFKMVMREYGERHFEDKFWVNHLHLWIHEDGFWKTIETFSLNKK